MFGLPSNFFKQTYIVIFKNVNEYTIFFSIRILTPEAWQLLIKHIILLERIRSRMIVVVEKGFQSI